MHDDDEKIGVGSSVFSSLIATGIHPVVDGQEDVHDDDEKTGEGSFPPLSLCVRARNSFDIHSSSTVTAFPKDEFEVLPL